METDGAISLRKGTVLVARFTPHDTDRGKKFGVWQASANTGRRGRVTLELMHNGDGELDRGHRSCEIRVCVMSFDEVNNTVLVGLVQTSEQLWKERRSGLGRARKRSAVNM